MLKVVISVLIALLIVAYGAAFLAWNMTSQDIVGWQAFGVRYSQHLPVGSLVFVGLILGAVIMAIAAGSTWAAQKSRADRATAMVKKAKVKLQAQLDEINDLRDEVERLEAQVASLQSGDGTWGQATYAEPPADTATEAGTAVPAETEVDDDDVI
ncbi:MAG: bZIP transcription factor [Armatimonadia bacterium]